MIVEGTLCGCPHCGGLVPILGSIEGVFIDPDDGTTHLHWRHSCDGTGCRRMTPSELRRLKDFVARSKTGSAVAADGDLLMAGYTKTLEAVATVSDLEVLWQTV